MEAGLYEQEFFFSSVILLSWSYKVSQFEKADFLGKLSTSFALLLRKILNKKNIFKKLTIFALYKAHFYEEFYLGQSQGR